MPNSPHPPPDQAALVVRLRALCLRYPEVAESVSHGRFAWRAGKRQFAVARAAHEPDDAVVVRVDPGDRDVLLTRDDVWLPAYDGVWGYLAIRAGPDADWDLIEELLDAAYRGVANQRQLRALDDDPVVPVGDGA